MLQLDLTQDETMVLRQVLEDYLSDLRMEIVDTDSMDFRDMLKRRKTVLTKVLEAWPAV
jgi:hypothetical protein